MKKLVLLAVLLTGGGIFHAFGEPQNIPMQVVKEDGPDGGNMLAPARPWYITQDDYVLTLPALGDDYTLELRDEDGEVVYTTYLPAGTTSVVLPSTLSGDFEIRLVGDTYYYKGYIEL